MLSVRLSWRVLEEAMGFLCGYAGECRKKQWAFCEVVAGGNFEETNSSASVLSVSLSLSGFGFLKGCAGGFSFGLSVRWSWRVAEEVRASWKGTPAKS